MALSDLAISYVAISDLAWSHVALSDLDHLRGKFVKAHPPGHRDRGTAAADHAARIHIGS